MPASVTGDPPNGLRFHCCSGWNSLNRPLGGATISSILEHAGTRLGTPTSTRTSSASIEWWVDGRVRRLGERDRFAPLELQRPITMARIELVKQRTAKNAGLFALKASASESFSDGHPQDAPGAPVEVDIEQNQQPLSPPRETSPSISYGHGLNVERIMLIMRGRGTAASLFTLRDRINHHTN